MENMFIECVDETSTKINENQIIKVIPKPYNIRRTLVSRRANEKSTSLSLHGQIIVSCTGPLLHKYANLGIK